MNRAEAWRRGARRRSCGLEGGLGRFREQKEEVVLDAFHFMAPVVEIGAEKSLLLSVQRSRTPTSLKNRDDTPGVSTPFVIE